MRSAWILASVAALGCNTILGISAGQAPSTDDGDDKERGSGGSDGLGGLGGAPATGGQGVGGTETETGTGGEGMGGACTDADASWLSSDGFMQSGDWQGEITTHLHRADSSCDELGCFACDQACAKGSLKPESGAMVWLDFTLNQERDGLPELWSSGTTKGVELTYRGEAATVHRLELDVSSGATVQHFCALLPENAATRRIPWSMFTTSCWNESDPGPSPSLPFEASAGRLLIFSTSSDDEVPFDSCLLSLAPYTD